MLSDTEIEKSTIDSEVKKEIVRHCKWFHIICVTEYIWIL